MVCDDNYEKQIGIKIAKGYEVDVNGKNALNMFVLAYAPILSFCCVLKLECLKHGRMA
jgi:hypothetical protein